MTNPNPELSAGPGLSSGPELPTGPEPGRGNRGGRRIDPADRRQLADSPVSARRIAALFRDHTRPLAVVVVIIVATSLLGLANPFLLRAIIDQALPAQNLGLLALCVGAMILIAAATGIFGVLQTWLSTRVGQRVMHTLRTRVFDHLQRQSLAFFTRTRGGEIQSRITQDIAGMQSVVTTTATSIAANLTTVVATAVAMGALSWRLSLISAVVLPPAIWTTRKVALLRRDVTGARQRKLADLHNQVTDGLSVSAARLTKTLGTQDANSATFAATSKDLIDLELRSQLAGRWRMATMSIIFAAIPALSYLAAGLPATRGAMTIGTLVAFTTLQAAIFRPLMALLDVGASWVASMALFSRIFEYLDLPVEVAEPETPVRLGRIRGEVVLDRVHYRYPDADADALHDVRLTVPAGSSLALVGSTGSGKSTLAALISRLADPTSGRLLIDGHDVRELGSAQLSSIVGVVSQETYLVHASIRQNLLLARPDADEAALWQALATAQAADLVAGLPAGLDTMVGARGHRFSGGEQQRLSIARTLLRDPAVLVLDEATSALDNATERELQLALDNLSHGRTTITVAHRLSTIRDADQIAVLDRGRVVQLGEHAQLLGEGGAYAALARSAEGSRSLAPAGERSRSAA